MRGARHAYAPRTDRDRNHRRIFLVSRRSWRSRRKRNPAVDLSLLVVASPKILTFLYFGIAGLIDVHDASAADAPVVFKTATPFVH